MPTSSFMLGSEASNLFVIAVPASLVAYVVVSNAGLFHVATKSALPAASIRPFVFAGVNPFAANTLFAAL